MGEETATWVALTECLGMQKGETLMQAAARLYSHSTGAHDDPLQAVAIAVLRSAGYGQAETWERLRRARELIPRLRAMTQAEIDAGNGGVCFCGHTRSDHDKRRCENDRCSCTGFEGV